MRSQKEVKEMQAMLKLHTVFHIKYEWARVTITSNDPYAKKDSQWYRPRVGCIYKHAAYMAMDQGFKVVGYADNVLICEAKKSPGHEIVQHYNKAHGRSTD